jgi:uncharacterized membrane protein YfcA
VMDALQIARGRWPWHLWRRFVGLLGMTVVGAFLGTRILISVAERFIYLALAAVILLFVVSAYLRIRLAVSPRWEKWLSPTVGLAAGTLAGVTNVPGPVTALYLVALGLEKRDFVQATASIVLTAKLSQWAAISRWGLYTTGILWWSVLFTVAALSSFWVGLRVQDRVRQVTFSRILHALLFGMGMLFVYRGLA